MAVLRPNFEIINTDLISELGSVILCSLTFKTLAFVELLIFSDYFILQRRIMIIHELKQANVDEYVAVDEGQRRRVYDKSYR